MLPTCNNSQCQHVMLKGQIQTPLARFCDEQDPYRLPVFVTSKTRPFPFDVRPKSIHRAAELGMVRTNKPQVELVVTRAASSRSAPCRLDAYTLKTPRATAGPKQGSRRAPQTNCQRKCRFPTRQAGPCHTGCLCDQAAAKERSGFSEVRQGGDFLGACP